MAGEGELLREGRSMTKLDPAVACAQKESFTLSMKQPSSGQFLFLCTLPNDVGTFCDASKAQCVTFFTFGLFNIKNCARHHCYIIVSVPSSFLIDEFWESSRSTKEKVAMPSGGDGSSCSPIRAIAVAFARRPFSPRAVRAPRPATGEPIVQIDRDQNPQPTNGTNPVPGVADQQVTMISIPACGPDDGQMMAPYVQQPQPATSDVESAAASATTLTCEGTPIGDEEPSGLFMSDTDPLSDPSIDREVFAPGNLEDAAEAADRHAPDLQDGNNQPQPSGHCVVRQSSTC